MGPYVGGQAEFVKVPFADFNALKLPPGKENEADFALLADIFPTGWHGVQLSVRLFSLSDILYRLHRCKPDRVSKLESQLPYSAPVRIVEPRTFTI